MTWTWRRDLPVAIAVAGMTLALYVGTLQPDFGGPEDTPKFQFLGYVLGTAHPPGYPLYVLLSHLFVQLPIGSVAYRANLFSAVMASLSCGLAYWIARELGARWWASAGAALALAAGASFWRSAVYAEVYSLAAALAAASTGFLLAWGNRGGTPRLLGAVGSFAAGFGNHLTIVGIVPAAVCYAIVRRRSALTIRVLAAAALIGVAGLAQYGFILERTRQGGTYLESRAETVAELIGVIRADRFAEQRFAFSAADVVQINVPAIARLIAVEVKPLGLVCFLLGLVAAIHRRSSGAALVLGCAAGMLAMIVNMEGDLQGFITPVVVLLWPVAAFGLDTAAGLLASLLGSRVGQAIACAIALALPTIGVTANYREADQSRQTASAEFFRATYAHLPDGAAVVPENYFYDMAHEYFIATGEAGPPRGMVKIGYDAPQVRAAAAAGRRVFAFAGAAAILAGDGLWFERTTLHVEPLEAWLRQLPRDTVLVGAAATAAVPFDPAVVGHLQARGPGRASPFEAFALVAQGEGAVWKRDEHRAAATLPHLPAGTEAVADDRGARVVVAGRPLAAVPAGLVIAAFTPDGAPPRTFEFASGEPVQVGSAGAVYELKGETPCVTLRHNQWQALDQVLSTGSAVATLAALGSAKVEVQFPDKSVQATAGPVIGDGETTLEQKSDADGSTVEWRFSRRGARRPLFRLALNQPGGGARARLATGSELPAATICSHRSWRPLAMPGGRIHLGPDFESEAFFGAGWGLSERRQDGVVRTGESGATLLLPLDPALRYRARFAFAAAPASTLEIFVNGTPAGTCRLEADGFCEFIVPAATRPGMTMLRLDVSPSSSRRTFRFAGAWFEPLSAEYP